MNTRNSLSELEMLERRLLDEFHWVKPEKVIKFVRAAKVGDRLHVGRPVTARKHKERNKRESHYLIRSPLGYVETWRTTLPAGTWGAWRTYHNVNNGALYGCTLQEIVNAVMNLSGA